MSASVGSGLLFPLSQNAMNFLTYAVSRSSFLADSTMICEDWLTDSEETGRGYSSTTTWAFVPLKPKELIAARFGVFGGVVHSVNRVFT